MAATQFGINHPMSQSVWAKRLTYEALHAAKAGMFVGKSSDSLIEEKDELTKDAGSEVKMFMRSQLQGEGKIDNETLSGNEEALAYRYDKLVINQLRHGVSIKGRVDLQRVSPKMRDEALSGLRDWWADRLDTCYFNQLAGNTFAETTYGLKYTGLNSVSAPTRQLFANSKTSESGGGSPLAAGDKFTLDLITKARIAMKTGRYPVRPLKVGGMETYILFLHPYQVFDLKSNTATGQWQDIQKAAMNGGLVTKNPIFTGALGMYDGVLLHEADRIPWGLEVAAGAQTVDGRFGSTLGVANIARAVMCGAQAAWFATGRENGSSNRYRWTEESRDHDNELAVASALVFGIKKARFRNPDDSDARDNGVLTISSYSLAA